MLESYVYPREKKQIFINFNNYDSKKNKTLYLIKPPMGSVGSGIKFLNNITNVKYSNYIITKYLHNPHLIRGYKYDIRFHALISSIKPLKLYMYDEGFLRIATEKFNLSVNNKFSYLTNIYVNRNNTKKYKYPLNENEIEESNLWNLEMYEKYCKINGLDYNKLFNEIIDIFIKMVFSVRNQLIKNIKDNNLYFSNFYHLIGFDIIFDENLKPYLLETNRRCGLRDDNASEKKYTHNIIADTLNIVGIKVNKTSKRNNLMDNKQSLKDIINDELCELERPRGGYKLVFPLKENINKYSKYYLNDIPDEDLELWKYLKE